MTTKLKTRTVRACDYCHLAELGDDVAICGSLRSHHGDDQASGEFWGDDIPETCPLCGFPTCPTCLSMWRTYRRTGSWDEIEITDVLAPKEGE